MNLFKSGMVKLVPCLLWEESEEQCDLPQSLSMTSQYWLWWNVTSNYKLSGSVHWTRGWG